jgi:hypothetical protein
MRLLVIVMSAMIAAIGAAGIVAPLALLDFGRSLQTPNMLHVVAAVRIVYGAAVLWVASASRMPIALRVIGIAIIVSGLLTPYFGVERAQALLIWWGKQGLLFMRAWAGMALLFGLFVVYAVAYPRRSVA